MTKTTWRKTGVYVLVVLPALGLAGIGVIARQYQQDSAQQSTGDPVADAARKAREKKKESPKPKKVYENEDVSTKPAATETPVAAKANPEGQPSAEAQPKDGAVPETNKNDEASWRKRFAEQRDKIAQAEKELDILQREQEKAQVQYYSDPQKAMNEQYTRKTVNDKDTKIAAKKQEIEQLKQGLATMDEELRKSGGDPGWAR